MDFEAVNIAGSEVAKARLTDHGLDSVPAVCFGDRCVPGGDLVAIAELLGLDYAAPDTLTPSQLFDKFVMVLDAACRFMIQVPFEGLSHRAPDRDRTFRDLGWHIVLIGRAFVAAYDSNEFPNSSFREENVPTTLSGADIAAELKQTQAILQDWWQTSGREDPLDRVIDSYWGNHTLHEVFERETWHTAQHTRQVMMFLEQLGIAPEGPLTAEDLAGLPLPERVWD